MVKSILKKVVFSALSLFVGYRTWDLLDVIRANKPSDFGCFQTCLVAFLLTLFLTGVCAFLGFAFPTSRLLPNSYYQIKSPKSVLFWMRIGGVEYFKKALLFFFWGRGENRKKFFKGTKSGLVGFVFQTKQSEFGHFASFVLIILVSIPLALDGFYTLVLMMAFFNLIGNVYPIILQRSHRLRLQRVTNLLGKERK